MKSTLARFSCLLFVTCWLACDPAAGPVPIPGSELGSISIDVAFPNATTAKLSADPLDVMRVAIQVTWDGGQIPPIDMTKTGPVSYNLVVGNLPANTPLNVQATGYDNDNVPLFSGGVAGFEVQPDATSDLVINLLSVVSPTGAGAPPKILTVHKPLLPVYVSSIFPIEIDVQDPDSAELQFQLTANHGQFSPSSGAIRLTNHQATIVSSFTAPATAGIAQLTFKVTDYAGFSSTYQTSISVLDVPPPDEDPGSVNGSVNFAPAILSLDVSMIENRSAVQLFANVTDDQPVTGLTYSWTINNAAAGTTNPISTASNSGVIDVLLTVADSLGAATTVNFDVNTATTGVVDLPLSNQPPILVAAFLSQQNVSYGDVVTASLYASDPEGQTLSAGWTTNWGTILSTTSSIDGPYSIHRAEWTGGVEAASAALSATISDPQGGLVLYTFDIHQVLGRVGIIADAGPDQTHFLGQPFMLDGSASSSEDGQVSTYHWQQLSGPASTIASPDAAQSEVTPTVAGTYVYQLAVTNINNDDTDTVSVTVSDPTAFGFTEADSDQNGVIYFLDVTNRKVRRYSMPLQQWLNSFDTVDTVACMAVAPAGDIVYVGVAGGRIDAFDTSTGARTTFTQNTATVDRMVVAGDYLFFQEIVGSVESRGLFSRANGNRTAYNEVSYRSNGFVFSAVAGKVFQQRDNVSPNDILQTTVNQSNGTLGSLTDSPYHGDYGLGHPLRLFPDESKVIAASGVFFSTTNLTFAGSLGNSYVDLSFMGDQPCIIKATGSNTQVLFLAVDYSIERIEVVTGAPLRLFDWDNDVFVVSTNGVNNIRVTAIPNTND